MALRIISIVYIVIVLSVYSIALTPNKPIPKSVAKYQNGFYPDTPGTTWAYKNNDGEWTETITSVEKTENTSVLTILQVNDRKQESSVKLEMSDVGISRVAGKGSENEPPVYLLKLPIEHRASWHYRWSSGIETSTIEGTEEVKVPAGKFTATTVIIEHPQASTSPISPMISKRWFVKGVGLVKLESGRFVQELISFKQPK